jgi:mono/diheme cytochrome c family protein
MDMKRTQLTLIFVALSFVFFSSCKEGGNFREGKIMAGGKVVSADTLNRGSQIYKEYCMACHGANGDGKGVAAKGLTTPPRDFTLGIIKFGDVLAGELPSDKSIYQSLSHGLNGTAMLPWDLMPGQMNAVWQYIKTFAPKTWEGKDKKIGEVINANNDPFGLARKSQAIKMGREVYHVSGSCQTCHRGYITLEEYSAMSKKLTGDTVDELEEDFFQVKPQESEHNYMTVPPDFTWHKVRSVRGNNINDLYLRIAAGVGGTAMPAWKETLKDEEVWAVAYYIQDLMQMRTDEHRRKELISKLGK